MGDGPRLFVAAGVEDALHALPARPWEVGGWLLGYWAEGRDALVVTHATPPARRGTPAGVWISGAGHRARFDEAWDASGGAVTFLGDWHTHPGGPARPSRRDALAAAQLATDPDFRTPEPLLGMTSLPRWSRGRTPRDTRWWLRDAEGDLRELSAIRTAGLPEAARVVPSWAWPASTRR